MEAEQLINFLNFVDSFTYILDDTRHWNNYRYGVHGEVVTTEQLADKFLSAP